jgi:hypothetical protein
MPNDQTAHYKFPLPHAEHLLSEDVDRLRESLTAVDRAIYEAAQEAEQALEDETAARSAEKEEIDAQLKKLRTLALAGL